MLTEFQALKLTRAIDGVMTPADRRPAHEWAKDNISLHRNYAQEGPFVADKWMVPIFEALHNPECSEVTFQKPIQTGGTLLADIWVAWLIVNQPGPIMWTFQSDEMAKDHGKTRLMPLLKRNKATKLTLPSNRAAVGHDRIMFDDFFLILNSANLNHLQSKSIRYKINSELWLPSWQGMMVHARGRVRRFEEMGTSKIYNESQGGSEGSEIDLAYRAGSQGVLAVDCGGGLAPLSWQQEMPDKKKAGVVWEPDAYDTDGNLSKSRVLETVRYRCPKSGIELPDDDKTRSKWNDNCEFIHADDANTAHRSFTFPALLRQKMRTMAAKYVDAYNEMRQRGNTDPMRDFVTKDLAQSWKDERESSIDLSELVQGDFTVETYRNTPIEGELGRVLAIDRQKDHFWAGVFAFTENKIKVLFFGRRETRDDCDEIRIAYMVKSKATVMDDRYDPTSTHEDCLRGGYIAIGGYPQRSFARRSKTGKDFRSIVSAPYRIMHQGRYLVGIKFASDPVKDMSAAYLEPPQRITWATDIDENFTKQLNSEERKEKRPGVYQWEKVQKRNDSWDCLAMAIAFAIEAKWIRATVNADIDNDEDEG